MDEIPTKLMVVAHPDDEALFGGAQLIKEGGWKVVCVTNGLNPVRKGEFHMVMYVTHTRFEIWDYYDEQYTPLDIHVLAEDLKRVVNERQWEKIVTHNEDGEYGHLHHKQIHDLMKGIVGNKLWTFNFEGPELPEELWQEKLELLKIYQSQADIINGHVSGVQETAGYGSVDVRRETISRGKATLKML